MSIDEINMNFLDEQRRLKVREKDKLTDLEKRVKKLEDAVKLLKKKISTGDSDV